MTDDKEPLHITLVPETLEEMVVACEQADASIDSDPHIHVIPTNRFMAHLCQRILAMEGP